MVKIISRSGEEMKFDSKDVERDLEASGVPERVAEEVAERVEDRVEDNMTAAKVNEQVEIELKRLEEDIQRGHNSWAQRVRSSTVEGTSVDTMETAGRTDTSRTDTFIPESQRERHEHLERGRY